MRQMPVEGKKFKGVDAFFRHAMTEAVLTRYVIAVCTEDKMEENFKDANENLDQILKGLNEYLEMKRLAFPRFFFLSNDELLEILSQTKDPKAVQPHLGKCFENINALEFKDNLDIIAMYSSDGEHVPFDKSIKPTSQVEMWLLQVEGQMRESLATSMIEAIETYPKQTREEWVMLWPAQHILAGSQYYWTQEVEEALLDQSKGGPSTLLSSSDSSLFLSTCSSLPLVFGCSNVAC